MGCRRDFKGRAVASREHYANCLIWALRSRSRLHGRLKAGMNGWVPHFSLEAPEGTYEFVYGNLGRNFLFPLLFKGYAVFSSKAEM
jgi:hypothetical protein